MCTFRIFTVVSRLVHGCSQHLGKWEMGLTERHFEMGLHQAVIKGECLYNRGVCLGALLKLMQSQHPICILLTKGRQLVISHVTVFKHTYSH